MTTHHVVQYSGGVSSWAAARLVLDREAEAGDRITLLFADVLIEDRDTYAFLEAGAAELGLPITRISEGETPWDVFRRKRMLGNSRVDPCSLHLKRAPLMRWIAEHCAREHSIIHYGLDFTEVHRLERLAARMGEWRVSAPLITHRVDKAGAHAMAEAAGLPSQRLYAMGLSHANCGGGCVKAGQGHWVKLLERFPERFAEWEREEADMREYLDRDVAMLAESVRGGKRPLPLSELRRRHEAQLPLDLLDIGGCGCALD